MVVNNIKKLTECMDLCGREMTLKEVCTSKCCNFCDVPYLYLEKLPAENSRLLKENVGLGKRVTELANENRDLRQTNGKLEKIIDLILNYNSVWNIKFLSRDDFFIWVKRTFSGVFDD